MNSNYSYNYSAIKNRDKRLYSISGTKISSSGYSYGLLKIAGITLGITNVIGIFLCIVTGKFLYNPISNGNIDPTFLILIEGSGIGMAMVLYNVKIQNYRLYQYLLALIKPKLCYDEQSHKIVLKKIKSDNFIERGF